MSRTRRNRPASCEARPLLDAEDGAEDDVERDPLGVRVESEGPAHREARHSLLRYRDHRTGVGEHALAVEGRHQEPALAQVLAAVEEQHRARAEERLERRVGLAGAEHLRIPREDLPHGVRVDDVDLGAEEDRIDREDIAVVAVAVVEEVDRAEQVRRRLRGGGEPRAGRERHVRMVGEGRAVV